MLLCLANAVHAQTPADAPLSSIGWLSDSLADMAAMRPDAGALPRRGGSGAAVPVVTVTPLDGQRPDAVGLLEPGESGLPATFWGASTTEDVIARLARLPDRPLPAARDELRTILLTRLDPPRGGAATPGAVVLARIDTLLRWGMLDEAAALIGAAGADRPALFRRAFDVALLQDREDEGCAVLRTAPGIAPSIPARIFCLARSGDWSAAALTLETAEALGQVSPSEDALLARFLDPELAETGAALPAPEAVTPLEWRMREAIGERLATATLTVAFAHGDLRPTAGWKLRIEAGERLTRAGGLDPDRLGALYREREPAASGGVWERVAAIQSLDSALQGRARDRIRRALEEAWQVMRRADLALAFARLYGPRLAGLDLQGLP
ncbi:MAG: hypothetical protein GVY27_09855, partial [Deinococcus-Thermus bacterium]|nr:hypothetical protein [Deinococcota bacterium]